MAFLPQDAKVYIGAASTLASAATQYESYLTNFEQSGGEIETETIKVFGGGNIHKESEKNEIEITFDFVMRETLTLLLDQMIAGSTLDGSTAVTYANDPTDKVIYVELTGQDGSTIQTRAYNNVKPTQIEVSMEADGGYAQGTLTFKVAPTQADGTTNVKIVKGAATTVSWP